MRSPLIVALAASLLLASCGQTPVMTPDAQGQATETGVPDFTEFPAQSGTPLQATATGAGGCGVAPNTDLIYNSWKQGYSSSIMARNFCEVPRQVTRLQNVKTKAQQNLAQRVGIGALVGAFVTYSSAFGPASIALTAASAATLIYSQNNTIGDIDRTLNNLNGLIARCKNDSRSEGVAYLLGVKNSNVGFGSFMIFATSTGRTFNTPQGSFISRDGCVYRS